MAIGASVRGQKTYKLNDLRRYRPTLSFERHAYITNVFVDEALRGGGIGQRLMDAALAFCRDRRVDSVVLWPTSRSRSLYARNGFAVRDDIMEANLDDGRALK